MAAKPTMDEAGIRAFLTSLFAEDLHAKRVLSLAHCTLGVIRGASLAIHSIGIGMAEARGVDPKHAIKQVDRMLSNKGIDVWALFRLWIPFVLGDRRDIVVTLDWTEHDHDDQTTIAINLVTSHGRATPLIWKTVVKSALKDNRNEYEDQVIRRLHEVLPQGVRVTLLADRGFGDQKLYLMLAEFGFHYVIRFREIITVTDSTGESHPASEWVPTNGRSRMIRDAFVTQDRCPVPAVVCVKESGMKENWCLATSRTDLGGKNVVELYGTAGACFIDYDSNQVRFKTSDMSVWETRDIAGADRFQREISHFADAVRGLQPLEVTGQDGVRALEVIEEIHASS